MGAIEEAERAGIDLSQIDANLSLSYEQRIVKHQEALNLLLERERVDNELRAIREKLKAAQASAAGLPPPSSDPP